MARRGAGEEEEGGEKARENVEVAHAHQLLGGQDEGHAERRRAQLQAQEQAHVRELAKARAEAAEVARAAGDWNAVRDAQRTQTSAMATTSTEPRRAGRGARRADVPG